MSKNEALSTPINTLLSYLMTKERVLGVISTLEDLVAVQQYNTVFDFQTYLSGMPDNSNYIKESLFLILKGKINDSQISTLSANDFNTLNTVNETLKTLEYVKITFAIEPSVSFLTSLYPRFQQIFGDSCIDTETDPQILGGCIFTFRGIYKDFSLRSSLEAYFNSKPEYVNQLLNK